MNESEDKLQERLGDLLQEAIRSSWTCALKQHPDEHIYTYILYTEPLLGYVVPSFNSEQALLRILDRGPDIEILRWSPPDWEYHAENREFFNSAQELLWTLDAKRDYSDDKVYEQRWNVFVNSLVNLDKEGLFGDGKSRSTLTINIMWGDQDAVAHVQSARVLNPMESYLCFARSQLPLLYASLEEVKRRHSAYKEKAIQRIKSTIEMVELDLKASKR